MKMKSNMIKFNKTEFNTNNQTNINIKLFNTLMMLDYATRVYGTLVHLVYIILILVSKKMQTRTLFYVNHATITNSFYVLMLTIYIAGENPQTPIKILNDLLCFISELIWASSNYLRMYSILLIAIYRYLSVRHVRLFKKLNSSKLLLTIPILFTWFFSFLLPISFKYILRTESFDAYCYDGKGRTYFDSIMYFVLTYLFMLILPTIAIISLYVLIIHNLKSSNTSILNKKNFHQASSFLFTTNTLSLAGNSFQENDTINISMKKKHIKFANQFACKKLIFKFQLKILI